ncbi:MAG: PAS domain S-box protein [Thermodesulfobacteriota bacterium]
MKNNTLKFEAKDAVNPSESVFLKIAASTLDAMIMIDTEGNVSFWNNAAEAMFGYSGNEAVGKPIYSLVIPSPMHEAHMKGFENFKNTGSGPVIGKLIEVEAMRKDGGVFPVELSLSAVKTKEGWNAVGIVRDISGRKILEEKLRTKLDEVERMNNLMVGRELKMEELRKEVRRLRATVEKSRKETPGPKEAR